MKASIVPNGIDYLPKVRAFNFMGIKLNVFTINSLMSMVYGVIETQRRIIIANHNLHSLALIKKYPIMAEFYSIADAVHIDGIALVLIGRALGCPLKRANRITYVDWMPHLMAAAALNRWRICCLGSKPGVGEAAADVLRKRFKGLLIVTHHGYFDVASAAENGAVLDYVNGSTPDILMVGMGMPRQERWILENLTDLPNTLVLPCGAALDYAAGIVPTPPRWTGWFCAEWLYRLLAEPQRMWHRYLVEPWSLAGPFAHEWYKRYADRRTDHEI
ncbi:MAG: WecB/TagA/CpsF family glycosyltransferase [Candidatus Cloacimonetes bacterium]|nr:WecB/TagA/CpsF family glycosyltransferase [Candidatus Cloacimonadota bacterium]